MGWARIDDGFDDHPKVLALLDMEDGAAAIGLWMFGQETGTQVEPIPVRARQSARPIQQPLFDLFAWN